MTQTGTEAGEVGIPISAEKPGVTGMSSWEPLNGPARPGHGRQDSAGGPGLVQTVSAPSCQDGGVVCTHVTSQTAVEPAVAKAAFSAPFANPTPTHIPGN